MTAGACMGVATGLEAIGSFFVEVLSGTERYCMYFASAARSRLFCLALVAVYSFVAVNRSFVRVATSRDTP